MRHYLDEETGDLPDGLPTPALNLALYFGSIVAWVTDHLPDGDWHTNVPCRRSPGRQARLPAAVHLGLERSPTGEPVLTGNGQLSVGQRDRGILTRQP
jgi:hypothetical protein